MNDLITPTNIEVDQEISSNVMEMILKYDLNYVNQMLENSKRFFSLKE